MKFSNDFYVTDRVFMKIKTTCMKNKYFYHHRRGLSTIVTTAMMLSFIATLGTFGVIWSNSNLQSREHNADILFINSTNQVKESLVLEHFWYDTSAQNLMLSLKGTGPIGMEIREIKISGIGHTVSIVNNPIALDTSNTKTSTSSSTSFSLTVANNANRMLVVTSSAEASAGAGNDASTKCAATSVTYSGQALTKATGFDLDDPGADLCTSIWYLINPPAGTANVVITLAGSITDNNVGASSLYNIAQEGPEVTATNSLTGNPPSITTNISTLTNNDWVIDSVGSGNAGSFTAGAGQNQIYNVAGGSSENSASYELVSSAGPISMTETQAANRLVHVLAAFKPVIQQVVTGNNQTGTVAPISNAPIVPGQTYLAAVKYQWFGDPIAVDVTTARGSLFQIPLVSPTDGTLIIKKVTKLSNGNFTFDGDLGSFGINTTGWNTGANLDSNGNLVLSGVIRDFNGTTNPGGHPDFEKTASPYGVFTGQVLPDLGADHEPVYNNATTSPWVSGFTRFNQWYHDAPGVNIKKDLNVTLIKKTGNPTKWIYNNASFFPIDNQLFKNTPGQSHNFHFTYEIHTSFTFQGQETFQFDGDDDVWVYINHKLAIDLGGVHGNATGIIDLGNSATRSALGITPGGIYDFDFFFAERHTTQSDMKITTSILLGKSGTGTTGAFFVDPGTYNINEIVPPGWALIDRQCDNGFTLPTSTSITITVPKGVTTCTFTNTK